MAHVGRHNFLVSAELNPHLYFCILNLAAALSKPLLLQSQFKSYLQKDLAGMWHLSFEPAV